MTMKSIVLAHVFMFAVCAWGSQVQIVRPPIKYWIGTVEFTKDVTEAGVDRGEKNLETKRGSSDDESLINRKGSTTHVAVHTGGESSVGVSATRYGFKPTGETKVNIGGGARKEWTQEEIRERRKKQNVTKDDIDKESSIIEKTTGNWKLNFTVIIQNISSNVTYVYDSVADTSSGLYIGSLVRNNPLRIPFPMQERFELEPNGGWAEIAVTIDVLNIKHKALLSLWDSRGVLKESLVLSPGGQFRLKDKEGNQHWCPSNTRNAVVIDISIDDSRDFEGMFPIVASGKGLTCEDVLDAVSLQLTDDDKFRFDDDVLHRGLGLDIGTFTNDVNIYAIMAEVNGVLRGCLKKDERLTSPYDSWQSKLRFIQVGTEELLECYQPGMRNYPEAEITKCLSYIESALTKTGSVSDSDLQNGAELALRAKDVLRYAHFLSCMSDESRNQYLKSDDDKQSAMEFAIIADNVEYFAKLYTLAWKWENTSRTMLGFAAEKGSLNIVKWLLESAPENERAQIDGLVDGATEKTTDDAGKTPLFWAAKNGHLKVCQYLVSKGADVNRQFYEMEEASKKIKKFDELVAPCFNDRIKTREYIEAERKVNYARNKWFSWRDYATEQDIRDWVLKGVSPNAAIKDDWNLLSRAVELNDAGLVAFLIDKGADPNCKCSTCPTDGRTALMLACEKGDKCLAGRLIEHGVDLYVHQDDGMSAFNYAVKSRHCDCAGILLDKLEPAKCSLVEDDDQKLNLFEYVGKYCEDKEFCETVKARYSDAWLNMLVSLRGTGFRGCLDRCELKEDEAEKLLEMYPSVSMADDLYDRGHLQGYIEKMPEGKRSYLQESDPRWIDCFYFLELREKAEQGDVESLYQLGKRYGQGDGVDKDLTKAFNNFCKAAEGGHAKACYNLSVCYSKGLGTPKDEVLAKRWKQEAVNRGFEK